MRRLLAVIALVVTTWPHIVLVGCAVAAASPAHTSGVSVMAEHAHEAPSCRALMTCNAAMIDATATAGVESPAGPPLLPSGHDMTAPITATLAAEPPPPRLSA